MLWERLAVLSSSTTTTPSPNLFVDAIDVATTTVTTSAATYAAAVWKPPEPGDEGGYPYYYDTDLIQENSSSALVDGSKYRQWIATADFLWNVRGVPFIEFISFLRRWGFILFGFLAGLCGAFASCCCRKCLHASQYLGGYCCQCRRTPQPKAKHDLAFAGRTKDKTK